VVGGLVRDNRSVILVSYAFYPTFSLADFAMKDSMITVAV
jgi:hypothetical protein